MSERKVAKPVALAVGAALASSFAIGTASAESVDSPFSMTSLSSGYMLTIGGEGSCGGDKGKEASCGGDKEGGADDKDAEASCGGDKAGDAGDKDAEASCGGDKADGKEKTEGSCGEGSCGGSM